MLKHFLFSALRNLLRHKVQSLINIVSLALGLAVFGFALLYVKQQLSYDRGWPDADRIHRLVLEQRGLPGAADGDFISVNPRIWPRVAEYFSDELDAITRVSNSGVRIKDFESPYTLPISFVDPTFGEIFPVEVVSGDFERALSAPGFIALDATFAENLGIDVSPGSRITLAGLGTEAEEVEFEVAAIYRLPRNRSSSMNFTMITLIHDYALPLFGPQRQFLAWNSGISLWAKLAPGVSTESFNALQPGLVQTITAFDEALGPNGRITDHIVYRWQPLPRVYFNRVGSEAAALAGDATRVATFAVVGVLVLLVGCSNCVSLSLASALERRKTIGIHKAVGALRRDIVLDALGECALLAMLALVPAVALLEALLPIFQTLMPFRVVLDPGWQEYSLLGLTALVVGLASGIYPALVLSGVRPQAVLKNFVQAGGRTGQRLRGLLVGTQFCLASILLISTCALYLQLAVTRAQPLGFNPDNLAFVFAGLGRVGNGDALLAELGNIPGVVNVSKSVNPPDSNLPMTANSASLVNSSGDSTEIKAQMMGSFHDTLNILEIPLLAGRHYDVNRDRIVQTPQDATPPERNLILNRTAIRALGFAGPEAAIGQLIHQRVSNNGRVTDIPTRIIGVVEDSLYGSLRRRPVPEIYPLIQQEIMTNVLLKYAGVTESELEAQVNEVMRRVSGRPPQGIMFAEQRIASAFRQEKNESTLLLVCGALALVLACIGLYGLAAFSVERRIKEVGVRKVLGASATSITTQFLWHFSRPLLVANLLAWPVALYFVLQWIQRFPYQIARAWLLPVCLATTATVLLIALLTVGFITYRAATARPVHALRYE